MDTANGFCEQPMNKKYSLCLLLSGLLFCSACSNVRQAPVVEKREADPAADTTVQPHETVTTGPQTRNDLTEERVQLPEPYEAPPQKTPETGAITQSAPVSENPAVIALLDDADLSLSQGNAEGAVSSIERALRLEPKNPWLWHRLAVLRLQQGQWRQAIALAEKSNSLSLRQPQVRKVNAEVISLAEEQLRRVR